MRVLLIAAPLLVLTACDDGSVPSPEDRMNGAGEVAAIDESLVSLRGDGMIVGAEAFYFAAGQTEVETALAEALGEARENIELDECGAGPMVATNYPGGLTVNFQNGNLAGWRVDEATDNVVVSSDVAIGTPRADLEALSGYSVIPDSTLGEEFIISGEVAGFVEADTVSMIYAGVQCFFR